MGILEGKVAAVTGGGRGIGRAVSKALAAQGAAVVVNDLGVSVAGEKETSSPADGVAEEIRKAGGKAASNHQDISTMEGGRGLVDQAISQFGKLDILVNIAGILRDRMIFSMSEEEWDAVIRVHLKGHFCTYSLRVDPHARAQGRTDHQFFVECRSGHSRSTQLCGRQGWNSWPYLQLRQCTVQIWNNH